MALTIATYLWLISLPFLLYFYVRLGKSKPLNSEERLLAWVGVALFILSVSFQSMEWFGFTPAFLAPYVSNILYSFVLVGAIAIALLVGRRTRKPQITATIVDEAKSVSPRYVESGTPFISGGEPIIVTSKLLAGVEFYPSREKLPKPDEIISTAKFSIDVLGFTCETWANPRYKDDLLRILRSGIRFRFIGLHPQSKFIDEADELNGRIGLPRTTTLACERLEQIKTQLTDIEKPRLDIRTYDLLPIHSIVAIDAESKSGNGVIQVENYMHGTVSSSWVSLSISEKEQPALFEKYWKSYEYVWKRSKPWP